MHQQDIYINVEVCFSSLFSRGGSDGLLQVLVEDARTFVERSV